MNAIEKERLKAEVAYKSTILFRLISSFVKPGLSTDLAMQVLSHMMGEGGSDIISVLDEDQSVKYIDDYVEKLITEKELGS